MGISFKRITKPKIRENIKLTLGQITIIGLIALVPSAYFGYKLILPGRIVVEFDVVDYPPIVAPTSKGYLTFAFYKLAINNKSSKTKTIKSLELEYFLNDTSIIENLRHEIVGDRNGITLFDTGRPTTFTFLEWKNLTTKIHQHDPLEPGAILLGSGVFIFNNRTMDDYEQIEKIQFIVSDFSNKTYKSEFELKSEYTNQARAGLIWRTKPYKESK